MPSSARPVPRPRVPMWAKWVLSFGVGAILLVALIIFVDHHNSDSPRSNNFAAQTRANRDAELVVERDQAPHVIQLSPGQSAQDRMMRVVRTSMSALVSEGVIDGPLQHVRCTARGAGDRLGLSCVATADDVNYDFVGAASLPAHRLTYCKRDEPPVPSMTIPVSPRCQA